MLVEDRRGSARLFDAYPLMGWTRDPQWQIRNAFAATTRDRNVAVKEEWD